LLPIQILWINLITDGLPGLTLSAEPSERNAMMRPPRPPAQSLFADGLGRHVLIIGSVMTASLMLLQYIEASRYPDWWQTILFTSICFAQLTHVWAIRSDSESVFRGGIIRNPALMFALLLTIGLQLSVVYLPVFHRLLHTQPVPPEILAHSLIPALVVLAAVELERFLTARKAPGTA
jgi:Ca2+-transporting ATPase